MRNNKTKKNKTKPMTIPQLRKAFENIDFKTKQILSKHPINKESIKEFQLNWKQTFGKEIDDKTAESYLILQSKSTKISKKLKKTRKQKGGMAPLDYTTRPGIEGTHGTFLPYISSGFKFYNSINNIAMDADCGKQDISPIISSDMGSNEVQNGGQLAGSFVVSTSPPSILQDSKNLIMGNPVGNSPDPTQTYFRK